MLFLAAICQNDWLIRKFADASHKSDEAEKARWLAKRTDPFPTGEFLSNWEKDAREMRWGAQGLGIGVNPLHWSSLLSDWHAPPKLFHASSTLPAYSSPGSSGSTCLAPLGLL